MEGAGDATVDILNGTGQVQTKTMQMEDELRRHWEFWPAEREILALARRSGISERTLKILKSFGRRANQWLPPVKG